MIPGTAIATENKNGFTYSLTSFGKAFVDFATESEAPVVDVGCAYGIATLPALLAGAGRAALRLGSLERAAALLSEATSRGSDDWRAWNALGIVRDRQRQWRSLGGAIRRRGRIGG